MLADGARWQAWDRFAQDRAEAGFMQSSWWAQFRASAECASFGVTLKDGGAIVGGAMVMRVAYAPQRCFYCISEGPVLPEDPAAAADGFDAVLGAVERHRRAEAARVSHLRIEPRWERLPAFVTGFQPLAQLDRYAEPRDTLLVDLRASPEEILAQMQSKGRYNVRLAQRHGVQIVEDASGRGLEDFLRLYAQTTARKRLAAKAPAHFRRLHAMPESRRHLSIYFAEHRGERLAAALVVFFGARATYFFGGSLDRERHLMAPYLLHFEIMRSARAKGCACYDLWGVAPRDRPDDPWHDISVFKRKFGGREASFVPTLDRVYDPLAYADYRRRAAWPGRLIAHRTAATAAA